MFPINHYNTETAVGQGCDKIGAMKAFQHDAIPFFRLEGFPEDGRQQHAIFGRQGGVSPAPFNGLNLSASVADSRENVYANRALAFATHGRSNDTVVHAHLVHGAEVARVSREDYGRHVGPTDALITNEPGCGLTMNYADCTPVFLYDPIHCAIGLGHAGWQGAVKDLPGAMVRAMQAAFGSDPARLVAGIGPCIGPCCYEVGQVVITAVTQAGNNGHSLLIPQAGALPHFNLPEANRRNLLAAGVHQVVMSECCTACHTDLFFSHRAEKGRTGRFGVLFLLTGKGQ
jgi:polyphenol oxidase